MSLKWFVKYRVIHKSVRDFEPLWYSSRDGHTEGDVNRGRDTPSFCPTLQVLDMSTLGDAADVNPVIKFLPHTLHMCGTCKVGQKFGVSLLLLTCSPLAWPSRLLYRRGRKSRRDLWITLRVCGRNLIRVLTSAASPRVDISKTCKVEQKFGVSLPLFTCSPSAWPSRILYRRGRKFRRDLRITLYIYVLHRHKNV